MPQIDLKERTANVVIYTFFYKRCWWILKHVTFTALSTTENSFFTRHLSRLLSSCEYCKVFKNGLFIKHLQEQSFADIPQNRVKPLFLKIRKLDKKALVLESLFKKTCRLKDCNFIKKDSNTGVFLWILQNF